MDKNNKRKEKTWNFFKPTIWKIVLTLIISILSYFLILKISLFGYQPGIILTILFIIFMIPFFIITVISSLINQNGNLYSLMTLVYILSYFLYVYIIVCLIVYIIKKVKKK